MFGHKNERVSAVYVLSFSFAMLSHSSSKMRIVIGKF